MARVKAPIYECNEKTVDTDLLKQLNAAIDRLEESMVPTVEITRGGGLGKLGYGVRKHNRSICADAIIAIARQIKGRPRW